MTKKEFVDKIAEKRELTKAYVNESVSMVVEEIIDNILEGDDLTFVGLGSFQTVTVPERNARNPKTGETIVVPEHKTVKFKVSPSLKRQVR